MTTTIGGPAFNAVAWSSGYVLAFFEWLGDLLAALFGVDRGDLFMIPATRRW